MPNLISSTILCLSIFTNFLQSQLHLFVLDHLISMHKVSKVDIHTMAQYLALSYPFLTQLWKRVHKHCRHLRIQASQVSLACIDYWPLEFPLLGFILGKSTQKMGGGGPCGREAQDTVAAQLWSALCTFCLFNLETPSYDANPQIWLLAVEDICTVGLHFYQKKRKCQVL